MKKREPYNEAHLLRLLAEGNKDAFDQVYFHYSPDVYRAAQRFLRDDELAADLVQEVFITIWLKRATFIAVENMKAYLVTMSRNLALSQLKKLSKEILTKAEWSDIAPLDENGTELNLNKQELEGIINEIIDMLPTQQRKVFQLAKMEGLTYQAIAAQLQISTITVKQHMIAANKFVRKQLKAHSMPLSLCLLLLRCDFMFWF